MYKLGRDSFWSDISQEPNRWRSAKLMLERVINFYPPMYESLKKIIQQHQPDCLVIDRSVIPAMNIAQQNNLPFVIQSRFLGSFVKPDPKYPQFGTAYSIHMNLWQKCLNILNPLFAQFYLFPTLIKLNRVRQQCTNQEKLPLPWEGQTTIVGTSFGIEIPRPIPPNIHVVGPIFPRAMQPLNDSLQDWLESDNRLVVYIAFGTLATPNAWQASALVEGLTNAGVRVLWSLPEAQRSILPQLPATFRIEPFVEQRAVLSHSKVAAFISHCGMNSINEALYYGKPILALPFFGDQHYNAARLVDLGVALKLNKQNFSGTEVRRKLDQILLIQSYRDNASQIAKTLQQTSGLDKSAEIIESI
ncbi:MAG: hypothetical protein C4288_02535 [Leptolyngbya sp. ERB_1_1]